jgi:hypothetical protein
MENRILKKLKHTSLEKREVLKGHRSDDMKVIGHQT